MDSSTGRTGDYGDAANAGVDAPVANGRHVFGQPEMSITNDMLLEFQNKSSGRFYSLATVHMDHPIQKTVAELAAGCAGADRRRLFPFRGRRWTDRPGQGSRWEVSTGPARLQRRTSGVRLFYRTHENLLELAPYACFRQRRGPRCGRA